MRDFTDDLRDVRRRLDEASEYLKIDESRNRLTELESEISRPDLWDDAERAKQVNTDYANVKGDVDLYDSLSQQLDDQPAASSVARSKERRELEDTAITRGLTQLIAQWRGKGDLTRLMVLELLWVKGWANRDVAGFLDVSEQQVANFRFAAVKKLSEHIRNAGLSADVFPELQDPPED